jgi:RecJ-like exonuclease
MQNTNHRVRESCMICDGTGKSGVGQETALCAYCEGSGHVFSRMDLAVTKVLLATGDCKTPMRLKSLEGGLVIIRRNS